MAPSAFDRSAFGPDGQIPMTGSQQYDLAEERERRSTTSHLLADIKYDAVLVSGLLVISLLFFLITMWW